MTDQGVAIPAICDNCGQIFASPFVIGPSVPPIRLMGNPKVRPCPNCQGDGTIPEGVDEFAEAAEQAVVSWTPDRREAFVAAIEAARKGPNPRDEVTNAISSAPELAHLVRRLKRLDLATFLAMVTVLLM